MASEHTTAPEMTQVRVEDLRTMLDQFGHTIPTSHQQVLAYERMKAALPPPPWDPPNKLLDDLQHVAINRGFSPTREATIQFARDMRAMGWSFGWVHPDIGPPMDEPILGLATTRELLTEVLTRLEVDQRRQPDVKSAQVTDARNLLRNLPQRVLDYRTVDG